MQGEKSLSGRNAFVSGAGRNLGRAIALRLAQEGASIGVCVSSNRDEALSVVDEVTALGVRATALVGDVSDREAVGRMFSEFRAELGPVGVLVNNASIRPRQAIEAISELDLDRVIAVNLKGAFFCVQEALSDMRENGWGRVVNISGIDAFVGSLHRAHVVATKAALVGLTRALAAELASIPVNVNAVVPGVFNTTRPAAEYPGWTEEAQASQIPLGRIGQPHELAELVTFAATSPFLTGQTLHLNGGRYFG